MASTTDGMPADDREQQAHELRLALESLLLDEGTPASIGLLAHLRHGPGGDKDLGLALRLVRRRSQGDDFDPGLLVQRLREECEKAAALRSQRVTQVLRLLQHQEATEGQRRANLIHSTTGHAIATAVCIEALASVDPGTSIRHVMIQAQLRYVQRVRSNETFRPSYYGLPYDVPLQPVSVEDTKGGRSSEEDFHLDQGSEVEYQRVDSDLVVEGYLTRLGRLGRKGKAAAKALAKRLAGEKLTNAEKQALHRARKDGIFRIVAISEGLVPEDYRAPSDINEPREDGGSSDQAEEGA